MHQQLALAATIPGAYWVEVYGHGTIEDGTRFLVVGEYRKGLLLAWRDGLVEPAGKGALLPVEKVRRVEGET